MTGKIYLDYCATTPVHPSVKNAMMVALDMGFGNPSSMHWAGRDAAQLIQQARLELANGLGCSPEEIYFTSGATESDNLALFGTMRLFPPNKAHLITSAIEHHAILHTAQQLEHDGYSVTYLPVDEHGFVDPGDVRRAIRPETRLISIMYVNNEIGSIQPVVEIGSIARENKVQFHTDAVQAMGLFDVNVKDLNVDMLSLSAHKIYGPKGIGALYVRKGIELMPLIFGGAQERSLRPGTENVSGILGLAAALTLVCEHRTGERTRLHGLRERLIDGMRDAGLEVTINGPRKDVAPHIISISFTGADAEMLLIRLNKEGVAVSMGSACTSHDIEPSHVLTAMGLPRKQIESTLRISLGMPTSENEIDVLVKTTATMIKRVLI